MNQNFIRKNLIDFFSIFFAAILLTMKPIEICINLSWDITIYTSFIIIIIAAVVVGFNYNLHLHNSKKTTKKKFY